MTMPTVTDLNPALIRERSSYPKAAYDAPLKPALKYEWKFEDRFGNRHGRLFYQLSRQSGVSANAQWVDVFKRDVHQSEFFAGTDFTVTAIADEDSFTIYRVFPPDDPVEIFRQIGKLELHGLSADGQFILIQSARNGNWFRPELVVMGLHGDVLARLSEFAGVTGCWAGAWAPVPGDQRIVFLHEATGFFQPAIWSPFEARTENVSTNLEGEVFATWDRSGHALILKRCLNGRSDLHRLSFDTRKIETIQPLDGTVWRHELDSENRVIGIWTSSHRYAESFREHERFPTAGFKPSVPLKPWLFRRIAGVPCFVIGDAQSNGRQWTIFDGYGSYAYHHSDGYNHKIQPLVDHGFQVVMVNTRGCNGFGRAWRESTQGNLGFTELEDLRRVRAALITEGLVDGNRTIITGDSWGGYMTLLAMGTQPDIWRMGMAGEPVGDFEHIGMEASPIIWAATRSQFGGDPQTDAAVYRKASPLTYVNAIRAPVLMVAGKYDLLCPPKQNIAFAEALRARGSECEIHIFEGAHGAPDREERIRQNIIMLEFLVRHCRAFDTKCAGPE